MKNEDRAKIKAMRQGIIGVIIFVGFIFGLGFHIADQLVWLVFDALKSIIGVPLG